MNINIYVENKIGRQLKECAKMLGVARNAIIREAIQSWLMSHKAHTWPSIILHYRGDPDFPAFESYRKEFKKNRKDDPFA